MKALLDLLVETLFIPVHFVLGIIDLLAPKPKPMPIEPEPLPEPEAPVVVVPPKPVGLLWGTQKEAWHSVRVLCDEAGLTYAQKNIVCACVYQESGFLTNPKPNQNKDPKTGHVWSTDYGIAQVNDYWHIGPGKTFPSVQYVLDNPEKVMRWMISVMKKTGALQPWSSYVTGAYLKWLDTRSVMWDLSK